MKRGAGLDERLPEVGERLALELWVAGEGEEDWVLEECQADCGRRGAQRENEAEVAAFWLEGCHCL